MFSTRNHILELIEQGHIPADRAAEAMAVAKVTPSGQMWQRFIDRMLLWLGSLALAFAVLFFIAYNWDEMGRFAKFGLVEALIALAIVAYLKVEAYSITGRASLLMASIFLGVLLALYGQTYQTGADPWQLFFNWALLMLPWAVIGRFPAIWVLWLALINLSIVLYFQAFRSLFWVMLRSDTAMLWLLFALNTLALVAWEYLAGSWRWLSERWAIRLIATGSGVPLTWLVLHGIFDNDAGGVMAGAVWFVAVSALFYCYRKLRPDLFMLAGGCLMGMVVTIAFLAKHLLRDWDAGSFLVLALIIIGLGTGTAVWLRNVHQEWRS